MQLDVKDLSDFYQRPIGVRVRRILSRRIRACWPDVSRQTVCGIGFATPYLGFLRHEASRVCALMPAGQGVIGWPNGANLAALIDDRALPLRDASVDRLLLVHHLELCGAERPVLREIWRVLAPEGRLLVIVPNRRGVWARRDTTPFGYGRPYSRGQIEGLLAGALLMPEACHYALATPPIELAGMWSSWLSLEQIGSRLWSPFSGVIMVEAVKEIAGVLPKGDRVPVTSRLRDFVPLGSGSQHGSSHGRIGPSAPRALPIRLVGRTPF